MTAIVEIINAAGGAFIDFALPMLIQSCVLILVLLVVDLILRKRVRAVFRYCIWMLVLVKLVLPPTFWSPVSIGTWFGDSLKAPATALVELAESRPAEPAGESRTIAADILSPSAPAFTAAPVSPVEVPRPESQYLPAAGMPRDNSLADADSESLPGAVAAVPPAELSLTWQGLVFLSWAAVATALLLLLVQRAFFVRGLVLDADEANAALQDELNRCRAQIGLRKEVTLRLSALAGSPAACGLVHPVILIPQNLAPRLAAQDVQAVLLHELAHIRRGDLWVNLAQTLLQIVYFYNPLLWLANSLIRRTREQAVDEAVLVAMGEAAQQYPETLVNVAKLAFRKRPGLSLRLIGVVESKSALSARIRHILNRPLPKTARLGIAGLTIILATAAVLLPMANAQRREIGSVESRFALLPDCGVWLSDINGQDLPVLDLASERIMMLPGVKSDYDLVQTTTSRREGDVLYYYDRAKGTPKITFLGGAGFDASASRETMTRTIIPTEMPWETTLITRSNDRYEVRIVRADERGCAIHFRPLKAAASTPKAILPNGIAVELIGVSEHPSAGKPWWRPDGSPLEEPPYDQIGGTVRADENREAYEFAVRLKNLPAGAETTMKTEPEGSSAGGGSPPRRDGQPVDDLRWLATMLPKDLQSCTVLCGVAAGEWETISQSTGYGSSSQGTAAGGVTFSPAMERSDDGVAITVTDDIMDRPCRIVAALQDGTMVESSEALTSSAGKARQTTASFTNHTLVQVAEFRFQMRPWTWVEFRNVSLRPGHKSDVQIHIQPTENAVSLDRGAGERISVEPSNVASILEVRVAPKRDDLTPDVVAECAKALAKGQTLVGDYLWVAVRPGTNVPPDSIVQAHAGKTWLLAHNQEGFTMVPGEEWQLAHVGRSTDRTGKPVIVLAFNDKGEANMQGLTEPNPGRSLAVIVNGIVVSAATIPEGQMRRTAVIADNFTERQRDDMIATLRRGIVEPSAGTDEDFRPITLRRNGVTVELLGICEHPSEGKQWWRPDGSPLEERPYDDDEGRAFPQAGEKGYKFAVKFSGLAGKEVDAHIDPSSSKTTNGGTLSSTSTKDGKENTKHRNDSLDEVIVWQGAAFDEELNSCDIRVGVSWGRWPEGYWYYMDRPDDPVEWAVFKNVSLRPGQRADVEARIDVGAGEPVRAKIVSPDAGAEASGLIDLGAADETGGSYVKVILGWSGQEVNVPGPLVLPESVKGMNEFQRWQKGFVRDRISFVDAGGHKYVVECKGMGKSPDGSARPEYTVTRYEPDQTPLAYSYFPRGDGLAAEWQTYFPNGAKKIWGLNQPNATDCKMTIRFYRAEGPKTREWHVNEHKIAYAEQVFDPNGASRFSHYLKDQIHSAYAPNARPALAEPAVLASTDKGAGGGALAESGQPAVKLPNGVTVRFLAYSQLTASGLQWWDAKSDLTSIPGVLEADVEGLGTILAFQIDPLQAEVYARLVRGAGVEDFKTRWRLGDSSTWLFAMGEERSYANVLFTTSVMDPPVVGLIPLTGEDQGKAVEVNKFGVAQIVDLQVISPGRGKPEEGAGMRGPVIQFTVINSPRSSPSVVAVEDKEGLAYDLGKQSENVRAATYTTALSPDQLASVVVEALPERDANVQFRNISLAPDRVTKVQVEADPTPGIAWQPSKVSRGLRFFIDGLDRYVEDHRNRLPASLQGMKGYLPEDSSLTGNIVYIGKGEILTSGNWILVAYDKTILPQGKGTYVVFATPGRNFVQFKSPRQLAELGIPADGAGTQTAPGARENMLQLGLAVALYMNEHSEDLPATLEPLALYLGDPQILAWLKENATYMGKGNLKDYPAAYAVVTAYEKIAQPTGERYVVFLDGHVELAKPERLKELGLTTAEPPSQPAGDLARLVKEAQPGAAVTVPKGTYRTAIEITKPLVLRGESQEGCIIEVTADQPAILVNTGGKGDVTIENVTIRWQLAGDKKMELPVALLVKDTNAQIRNCRFVPLGDAKRSPMAVYIDGRSKSTVDNCRFSGFEYTICYGANTQGVVQDCIITDCGHQGVINYDGATMTVQRCIITGSKFHAVRCTGGTLHVKDNLLIKNANRGIYLGNKSGRGTIANNLILGNGTGVSGFGRADYAVANNVIVSNDYAGIDMRDSCRLSIRNNVLAKNQRGIMLHKEGSQNYNVIAKNTYWGNATDVENTDKAEGSVTADPQFADPNHGDFSVRGPAQEQGDGLTDPKIIKELWERYEQLRAEPGRSGQAQTSASNVTAPAATGFSGRVVDARGRPVAGVQVALCTKDKGVSIGPTGLLPNRMGGRSTEIVQTDAQGRFSFAQVPEEFQLVAAHESGFAWLAGKELASSHDLPLQPWGRVEGTLRIGRETGDDEKVSLLGYINRDAIDQGVRYDYQTKTDAKGWFLFKKVPPGSMEVGYMTQVGDATWSDTCRTPVRVEPGESVKMVLGGTGRRVVGKFVPPKDYDGPVYFGEGRPEEIGGYSGTIEVPPMTQAYTDKPLDVGELTPTMRRPLHVGDVAPPFGARTLDGKDIHLADYKGKYVLLSFWQPEYHPELDRLKELYKTYGSAGKLQIIGLGGDDTQEEVKKYVAEHKIEWPEVFFGEKWNEGTAGQYGLSGLPYILLVNPEGKIAATWLRGEKLTTTVREAMKNVGGESPSTSVALAWQRTDRYVPPDPNGFFPDDREAGKRLDTLFQAGDKDRRSDEEILSTVRQGFRHTTHPTLILGWIGNRYIWGKDPQNAEAVEIMYHAVPIVRDYAVYFGLSVLKDKTPNVLRTLAEICMQGEEVGRITWGLGPQREELLAYITPYLQDADPKKREIAAVLVKHFRGELDFEKWQREKRTEQVKAEFSGQPPQLRQALLTGDSRARRDAFQTIMRKDLSPILDASFLPALRAAATDSDSSVRAQAAQLVGGLWVWGAKDQDPNAIELLLALSSDSDREVRYTAVYYGLSTVRNASEPIVRRLIEMAMADHENNLYGRIVWGLKGPVQATPELVTKTLAEHLDQAKSDVRHAASVYALYRDILEKEPPGEWNLARIKERYPEDLVAVPFSAKGSFQPQDADALWDEFAKSLPQGVTAERLLLWERRDEIVCTAKVRGKEQVDAVKRMVENHPSLSLREVYPLPLPMQLFLEELPALMRSRTSAQQQARSETPVQESRSAVMPAVSEVPGVIQQRIDAAAPGATIKLEPGLYKERLTINKPITLEGAGWDKTVIVRERRAIASSDEIESLMAQRVSAAKSDAEREQIAAQVKKELTGEMSPVALSVENAQDVVIRGIKFTSPGAHVKGASMNLPLLKLDRSRVRLSGCAVIGGPGDGVHILNGSAAEIEKTLVAAVWGTGISVGPGQSESGVRIHDCDVRNCHYAGIRVARNGPETVIERCRISGAAWHGIRYDDTSPQILGNLIFGHARSGIYASGQTAATVKGNLFYANEMCGMSCWFQNKDRIEGNTFVSNKEAGLAIAGASKPLVYRNIFSTHPVAISLGNIGEDSPFAKSDGNVALQGNLLWGNEQDLQFRRDANTTEALAIGEDTGTLRVDPGFAAPGARDFPLRADSPARPKGIGAVSLIPVDSPWPLQPEELAIIPKGDTRDSRQWRQ